MCEISELTVDVVHAKHVKRRDDDGGGDDVVGGGDDVVGLIFGFLCKSDKQRNMAMCL